MSRSRLPAGLGLAFLIITVLASPPPCLADGPSFLNRFNTVNTIASTVPATGLGAGDVNPYGTVVVQRTVGSLTRGNVLVSNFNNAANLQGTGKTVMQIAPDGTANLFATIDPSDPKVSQCTGGIGLTTALVVLRSGWVIVGSLPTTDGMSDTATAGCLVVLDSQGQVAETFQGDGINGPWDMTAEDEDGQASLFVTNVLNGGVTTAPGVVNAGTVLRIDLDVSVTGGGLPVRRSTTMIGSGFSEKADPDALIIGPTGVGLGPDGTLYVADSLNNRIAAIPNASVRMNSAGTGDDVSVNGALNDPLGLAILPNGNIVTANGGDGNLVETTPRGNQVAVQTVTANGAGALFGIAIVPGGRGVYFVDDGDNNLKVFIASH
jgi:hypothetical protein